MKKFFKVINLIIIALLTVSFFYCTIKGWYDLAILLYLVLSTSYINDKLDQIDKKIDAERTRRIEERIEEMRNMSKNH